MAGEDKEGLQGSGGGGQRSPEMAHTKVARNGTCNSSRHWLVRCYLESKRLGCQLFGSHKRGTSRGCRGTVFVAFYLAGATEVGNLYSLVPVDENVLISQVPAIGSNLGLKI